MTLFFSNRIILAAVAAVFLTVAMSVPGICAMAMAESASGEEKNCSCAADKERSTGEDDEDCQCGCMSVNQSSGETYGENVQGAIIADEEASRVQGATTWWTPKLLASLWLVDQLAQISPSDPPGLPPTVALPRDRSDTYLQNSIFLI